MNCKKCKYKMLYLGSNQNGYYNLCKKCNNVIPTNEKINQKQTN